MKLAVVIEPEAESDLASAIEWYDRHRSGLGDEFDLSVDGTIAEIVRMPELSELLYRGVRRRSSVSIRRLLSNRRASHPSAGNNSCQSRSE